MNKDEFESKFWDSVKKAELNNKDEFAKRFEEINHELDVDEGIGANVAKWYATDIRLIHSILENFFVDNSKD